MSLKHLWVAVMVLFGAASAGAQEGTPPLSGTFQIDIYNGIGGGSITSPGVQALNTNPLITTEGAYVGTATYTGLLDFALDLQNGTFSTIADFLDSGTGDYTIADPEVLDRELSSPPFNITTVLVINFSSTAIPDLSIDHDDGIGLYVDGASFTSAGDAAPTSAVTKDFTETIPAGSYQLVYVAANGNPSILRVRGTPAEPTPDFVNFGCRIDLTQITNPDFPASAKFVLPASSSEKFCDADNNGTLKLTCSGQIPPGVEYNVEGDITDTGITCQISGSQCGLVGSFDAAIRSIKVSASGFVELSCETVSQ